MYNFQDILHILFNFEIQQAQIRVPEENICIGIVGTCSFTKGQVELPVE